MHSQELAVQRSKVLIIIGAGKAGSTTLATLLRSHPDIDFLRHEFFDFSARDDIYTSLRALDDKFGRHGQQPVVGFKCAHYMGHPAVANRLAAAFIDPEIIVVLRDPVRRAISAWYWWAKSGMAPVEDHESGIRSLLDGQIDSDRWPHAMQVIELGRYGALLRTWRSSFADEHIHVFRQGTLDDPADALRRLYRNVGVRDDIPIPQLSRPMNTGTYSLARVRWLNLRLPFRWQVDAEGIWRQERPKRWLPKFFDLFITATDRLVLARLMRKKVSVSAELNERLTEYYAPDQALLEEELRLVNTY